MHFSLLNSLLPMMTPILQIIHFKYVTDKVFGKSQSHLMFFQLVNHTYIFYKTSCTSPIKSEKSSVKDKKL
jgi:hypothetical protein